ncbi:MAG: metallophosphoesterase family protein [Chloroflexi bacterium]|nr:metallophosphoesterase family protein [Chloroflexota bacterium]
MKIGLISDTHIPAMGAEPPPEVITAFEGVDVILHAGDINVPSCIDWLERIAPVHASSSFFATAVEAAPRVSQPIVVELEGHTIGVVHKLELMGLMEDVYPGAIDKEYMPSKSLRDDVFGVFDRSVDIVVFGYTHEALIETHEGILFVNPGSTSMVKQVMKLGHVATLEFTPRGPEAKIIALADLRKA